VRVFRISGRAIALIAFGWHEIRQAVDRRKIEMVWYKAGAPAGLAGGADHHHCSGQRVEFEPRLVMTQTSNRLFDEMARLMNDAAGVASGVRREFETVFRNQADRILRDLDVVKREEFEAVKEMARLAREETEAATANCLPRRRFPSRPAPARILVFPHRARYKRAEPPARRACAEMGRTDLGGRFVARGFSRWRRPSSR
jgi:BMFP domain-containing protein YqiC